MKGVSEYKRTVSIHKYMTLSRSDNLNTFKRKHRGLFIPVDMLGTFVIESDSFYVEDLGETVKGFVLYIGNNVFYMIDPLYFGQYNPLKLWINEEEE